MSKYFKVFKFCEDNITKHAIGYSEHSIRYVYYTRVLLTGSLTCVYYLRQKDSFITSGYRYINTASHINFYRHGYDPRNLIGKWCSIIIADISKECRSIVLEELYNELGSLENPEEDQIACYTFLINRLTSG